MSRTADESSIPTFWHSCAQKDFYAAFDSFQCVIFRQALDEKDDTNGAHQKAAVSGGKSKNGLRGKRGRAGAKKKKRKRNKVAQATTRDFQAAILETLQSASHRDQESWTIETSSHEDKNSKKRINCETSAATTNKDCYEPSEFLSANATQNGYCSFLLRDNSDRAVTKFTQTYARHSSLPVFQHDDDDNNATTKKTKVNTTISNSGAIINLNNNTTSTMSTISVAQPYWIFVGRNSSPTESLKGRTEHTDEIHPDCGGTFHFQAAGSKLWKIRPTETLRTKCNNLGTKLKDSYEIMVEQGDILVINTHLWWHQTEIPPLATTSTANNVKHTRKRGLDCGGTAPKTTTTPPCLSISYARDIYLHGAEPPTDNDMDVTNQEGAWATGFIAKGTTLLTEDANPPMNRTSIEDKSNCKLVVLGTNGDDGEEQWAVLATKDIQEGEFFLLLKQEDDGTGNDDNS